MSESDSTDLIRINILMEYQLNHTTIRSTVATMTKSAKRSYIISAMQTLAEDEQLIVLDYLDDYITIDKVDNIHSFSV